MSLSRKQFLKFLGFGGLAAGAFGPGRLAGSAVTPATAATTGSSSCPCPDCQMKDAAKK